MNTVDNGAARSNRRSCREDRNGENVACLRPCQHFQLEL